MLVNVFISFEDNTTQEHQAHGNGSTTDIVLRRLDRVKLGNWKLTYYN